MLALMMIMVPQHLGRLGFFIGLALHMLDSFMTLFRLDSMLMVRRRVVIWLLRPVFNDRVISATGGRLGG